MLLILKKHCLVKSERTVLNCYFLYCAVGLLCDEEEVWPGVIFALVPSYRHGGSIMERSKVDAR